MLKNNKFKFSFSIEVVLILVAFLLRIKPNYFNYGIKIITSELCSYLVYLLLFIAFGMYYAQAKGGILLSIAFFIELAFTIESLILRVPRINYFYTSVYFVNIVCAICYAVLILYGLNIIKNIKVCYVFIGLLLLEASMEFVSSAIHTIRYFKDCYDVTTFFRHSANYSWLLSTTPYLLINIAVLLYLLPSKKRKYIENKKSIEIALKSLKEDFENNLITEDEYLSKKKEYINNL